MLPDNALTLFTQGFLARLLPMADEVLLTAIQRMNPAAYPPAAVAAGIGALLASAVLYAIGVWLRRLPKRVSTEAQQERIAALRTMAHEWLPYLLILSASPIGGMLIVAAAFFELKPWKIAGMLVLAEIVWRASPVV